MFENFWFNVEYGINHVLNINSYDHLLFLIALSVPYAFKDWKRVLLLVSIFTLGHTLSLILAVYNVIRINTTLVEFLIPITILITGIFNLFKAGRANKDKKVSVLFFTTLFFGLIHGLGFAREFKMLLGAEDNNLVLLLEFALGIELSQVIIVFIVLFLSYVTKTIFRFTNRDWVMVTSSIVIGLVIPILLNSDFLS